MRVEVKILTYPLLSGVLLEYTMFAAMTFPLTWSLSAAQVPASHIASLFNVGFPSTPLKMKKVPPMTFHLLAAPHHHRTSWVLHS